MDSFFRNDNSVGENDTSVWLREEPFTPCSGRRNACRKMTDDNTHDTYLLHVERVGVFGAELRQLERRQAAGRFVRRGGQVRLLLHLRPPHRLTFFVVVSPDAWLRVTWLRFMLAVGGGRRPCVPRFRTVGRPRYRKIQIPLRFTGDVLPSLFVFFSDVTLFYRCHQKKPTSTSPQIKNFWSAFGNEIHKTLHPKCTIKRAQKYLLLTKNSFWSISSSEAPVPTVSLRSISTKTTQLSSSFVPVAIRPLNSIHLWSIGLYPLFALSLYVDSLWYLNCLCVPSPHFLLYLYPYLYMTNLSVVFVPSVYVMPQRPHA